MSWKEKVVGLYKRFGSPAKFAAKLVIGSVLPGGSAVIDLVGAALDCVHETIHDQIELDEAKMPAATAADLQRLEGVLDLLSGDLGALTAQVATLENLPQAAVRLVDTALMTDERCRAALCKLDALGRGFDRLRDQNDRLLRGQGYQAEMLADMRALLRRAAGVFEFVEDLRAGGLSVAELRVQLAVFRDGERALAQGRIAEAEARLQEAANSQPQSGTAAAALAAVQAVGQDLAAAEKTLTRAARLRPLDKELGELQRRVTQASRGASPAEGGRGAAAPPKVSDDLDGWRLEQMLGRGGWGQVFKASRGGEVRALKVMKPDLSRDPAFVERFKAEILTLAALRRQKHLVDIYSFGYAADAACWYFLMEFVDGWSLEYYLARRGPLTQGQAVALFARVAEGLAPVHAQGVVHLDVKPANILLRKANGLPVLVDFGLASAGGSRLTDCTPMFAAPEQLRGKPVDARTDVYALAASMYYALNYDRPEHREPDQFEAEQVPEVLREILTLALQPRPERRPANAAEFRDLLARATADPGSLGQLQRQPGERFTNSIGMKFAWIPPGTFLMGSPPNEEERSEDETQHKVTLTKGFFLGVHQVTQTQWYKIMHRRRSTFRGKDLPVETINWNDAVKFCAKLSERPEEKQAGRVYRLPTEAEWEYACRAGTTTPFHFGETISSNNANFKADEPYGEGPAGEWRETTVPVGSFQPNAWGLYDMHGNVYEWCADWYGPYPDGHVPNPRGPSEGQGRVSRGGSWGHQPWECRSAARCLLEPHQAPCDTGLRVCCLLGQEEADAQEPTESVVLQPGSFLAELRDGSRLDVGDAPSPAACLEAMLLVLHDAPETEAGQLDPETRRKLDLIAEAAQDPAKMQALLGHDPAPPSPEGKAVQPPTQQPAAQTPPTPPVAMPRERETEKQASPPVHVEEQQRPENQAVRRQQDLARLQQERETELARLVRDAFDRTEGKPTREDTIAANKLFRKYGIHADRARQIFREIWKEWRKTNDAKPRHKAGDLFINSLGMKFAWIPPGTFLMGSPPDEEEWSADGTQHKVTLTKGFHLGIHQVTQAHWEGMIGNNPSNFKGENLPVENVSWDDCECFCEALGKKDGRTYRLPTEAEWEYACRAGTTTPFHFGTTISTDQSNYDGNYPYGHGEKGVYREKTTPVGSFPANAWGLFDMHGNVWEWCADWFGPYPEEGATDPQGANNGKGRVLRGGSWGAQPWYCRSAFRGWDAPGSRIDYGGCGCRVVLCLD